MNFLSTIILVAFLCGCSVNAQKLHVAVYYESLCPDSIRFITNQLYPNYNALRNYIDILFVPFGKSTSHNNGQHFECQHGPEECEGNMIQSCTLYDLNGQPDAKMEYAACQMAFGADLTGQSCANRVNVPFGQVQQCMVNGLGTILQLEMERLTHKIKNPYPSFVPTIVYNNVFDQVLQDRSIADFVGVVCELLNNIAPICQTPRRSQH